MPTRPLTDSLCIEALVLFNKYGTKKEAAKFATRSDDGGIGINDRSFGKRLLVARARGLHLGVEPARPPAAVAYDIPPPVQPPPDPPPKPRYTVAIDRRVISEKVKVVFWTDSHDSPSLNKERFKWIGRYVSEAKPDLVVHGGDFSTFDSLCRYDPNDTLRGKQKPDFNQDIESLELALDWYSEGLGAFSCPHHITLGNHEDRVMSWMDRHPEVANWMDTHFYTVFERASWTYSPYGQHHFIAGCAFVHIPLNTMGKPYGGMYAENQIARDSLESVICGHSHKRLCKVYPKSCNRRVYIVNGGCALPDGHIERYAKHTLTGWSYGIYDLTLQGGEVTDRWVSMADLKEEYA